MTNFEKLFEAVKHTSDFCTAVGCLSNDFHNYSGEEDVVFENELLEDFCETHIFSWSCGASKVVLICDNEDYVLKTAYTGYAYEPTDKDGNYIEDADWQFECWDREDDCLIEYLVYRAAIEAGVDKFFAETIRVNDFIFMQEAYYESLDYDNSDLICRISKELQEVFNIKNNVIDMEVVEEVAYENELGELWDRLGSVIFALFFDFYTLEELQALQEFIVKYDINDLHRGNIGWFNGELKFVDYCGFGSGTSSIVTEKVSC